MSLLDILGIDLPDLDGGLCSQVDPEAWFPERGKGGSDETRRAKATCARCPVREQCLQTALADPETAGIWGGLTEIERRKLRRAAA